MADRPALPLATRLHPALGVAAVLLGVGHVLAIVLTRGGVKPFSWIGWLPEQLLVGAVIVLAGVGVVASAPSLARGRVGPPLLAVAVLALLSCAEFLRYFAPMPACFAIAALADGVLVASADRNVARRNVIVLPFGVALVGVGAFLVASYVGAAA